MRFKKQMAKYYSAKLSEIKLSKKLNILVEGQISRQKSDKLHVLRRLAINVLSLVLVLFFVLFAMGKRKGIHLSAKIESLCKTKKMRVQFSHVDNKIKTFIRKISIGRKR